MLDQRLGGVIKKLADINSRQTMIKSSAPVIDPNSGNMGEFAEKLQALRNELANLRRDFGK